MKWYQLKEQAAGEKRLMLMWFMYRLFGKKIVQFVAAFVAFFAFCFSKEIKFFTYKNLKVIYEYTGNNNAKPTLFNRYRLVLNYAFSLVDRMEVFSNNFNSEKLYFEDKTGEQELISLLKSGCGVFFISSHAGNIEVLRSFINSGYFGANPHVNIFLSESQCRIFNDFLKKIQQKTSVSTYPLEQINAGTAIELKDRIDNGEIVFIAGDRVSAGSSNVTFKTKFFGKGTEFPAGTFKLAQLMEVPVYFIAALKAPDDAYKIVLKRFARAAECSKSQNLAKMQQEYAEFLEKTATEVPLQFYHFYDMFNEAC